jgi:hypothetical protein
LAEFEFEETYRLSKIFDAPVDFVFKWCTDFREDDYKMKGTDHFERTSRRKIIEKTANRVVWVITYTKEGRRVEGIRAVWLTSPRSWHLETCGDHREIGDYKLTPINKNQTRLDMQFRERYSSPDEVKSEKEWKKNPKQNWDAFAKYLNADYRESRRHHRSTQGEYALK